MAERQSPKLNDGGSNPSSPAIYLYIKTHLKTGLKYFGKTTADPFTYPGSGKYWTRHLRVHGYDVQTVVFGIFQKVEDAKCAAIKFSIDNDIVNSDEWANLKPEELDGGWQHINNDPALKRMITSKAGKTSVEKHPEVSRKNLSKNNSKKTAKTNREKYGENFYRDIATYNKSEEHREKLRNIAMLNNFGKNNLGKKRVKYECTHCGKFAAMNVLSRFHLDNCKQK